MVGQQASGFKSAMQGKKELHKSMLDGDRSKVKQNRFTYSTGIPELYCTA